MTEGTIVHTSRISNVVILWIRNSTATSATPAMIQMVVRGVRPCRRAAVPASSGVPSVHSPRGPDQCLAAQLMQYRAAGFASRRRGSIGCPQSSQAP